MSDTPPVDVGISQSEVQGSTPKYPTINPKPSQPGPAEQTILGRIDRSGDPGSLLKDLAEPKTRLDPVGIREALSREIPVSELPAVDVVARQFDRNQEDILRKAPNASQQQVALSLAARFSSGVSLYQRISEQSMFGPKDYERFDDPDALVARLPEIRRNITDAERRIVEGRPSARIIRDNGWLAVEQGKHTTDYRIYLSPEPGAIGKVFSDLALTIPESVKYQMKTFDRPTHGQDVSRLDKIIMYVSDGDLDTVLAAVNKVYDDNQQSFEGRPAPGGGKIAPVDGVSITKQSDRVVNGDKITGTHEAADAIGDRLHQRLPQITKDRLARYKDAITASQSDEGRFFWSTMQLDQEHFSRLLYAGKDPLSESQRNGLTDVYFRTLYTSAMYGFSEGKPISVSAMRQNFIKSIQGRVSLTPGQLQHLITENMSQFQIESVQTRVSSVLERTGLAIAFNEGLANGQTAGSTFRQLLAT